MAVLRLQHSLSALNAFWVLVMPILLIPIGALLSFVRAWFLPAAKKTKEPIIDVQPYNPVDLQPFGMVEAGKLPLPEYDAVLAAKSKFSEGDFEGAKHLLINTWLMISMNETAELAQLQLKQGFVDLYQAKGDMERAQRISAMPAYLLDREVQWIVTHPDEQIGDYLVE